MTDILVDISAKLLFSHPAIRAMLYRQKSFRAARAASHLSLFFYLVIHSHCVTTNNKCGGDCINHPR